MRFSQSAQKPQTKNELIIELQARCNSIEQRYRDLLASYSCEEAAIRELAEGIVTKASDSSVLEIVEALVFRICKSGGSHAGTKKN